MSLKIGPQIKSNQIPKGGGGAPSTPQQRGGWDSIHTPIEGGGGGLEPVAQEVLVVCRHSLALAGKTSRDPIARPLAFHGGRKAMLEAH